MSDPRAEHVQLSQPFLRHPSYQLLRKAIAEDVATLTLVTGSGVSKPAGLPDWAGLREIVQRKLDDKQYAQSQSGQPFDKGLYTAAAETTDYWLFFKLAKKALSPVVFHEVIKDSLSVEDKEVPRILKELLRLRPKGLVTLNLDRLTARAIAATYPGQPIAQIFGTEINRRWAQILEESPYLLHMHGSVEDTYTWVLDQDDLRTLTSNPAHSLFLNALYTQQTVIFVGISAQDVAVSAPLISLKKAGLEASSVFWLTNRHGQEVSRWAEAHNVQIIPYAANTDSEHEAAISEFVDDLLNFRSVDDKRLAPSQEAIRAFPGERTQNLSPMEIANLLPEDARKSLSTKLNLELQNSEGEELYAKFMSFVEEYDYPIQTRAFYRPKSGQDVKFFDYVLQFPSMGKGNFGEVYLATTPDKSNVAVKIMHNNILQNEEMLGGFRRGSASMRILTNHNIDGIAKFIESFEMPPTIVMEFVSGNSLAELFDQLSRFPWREKVRMVSEIALIVDQCHRIPEVVLHRDIKPSNIMLQDVDYGDFTYGKLTVLDFDMSWHKGSSEKDVVFESRDDFGYLSPEQTDSTKISKSRSAKVDTYGLGMTAYALLGGVHPIPNVPLDPRWREYVARAARTGYRDSWASLPIRTARLIFDSTKFDQSDRLEFSSAKRRIEKISAIANGLHSILPIDFAAEELLAIVSDGISYQWDDISDRGSVEFAGGTRFESWVDLTSSELCVRVDYKDVGGRGFSNRNALVAECRKYMDNLFNSDGMRTVGVSVLSGHMNYLGSMKLSYTPDVIRKIAEQILTGVRILHRI